MNNNEKFIAEKISDFRTLNEAGRSGGVVFFGSTYFSRMNINELANNDEMGGKIYDRSMQGLKLADSFRLLESAVYELNPSRIFVNFGEEECQAENFNADEFLDKYKWLLLSLRRKCRNSRIYIVSVVSPEKNAAAVNSGLEFLAGETGCGFINVTKEAFENMGFEKVFNALKPFVRIFPVSFAQAMQMA
ncbi:hypothetical protein [Treponema sp.]|uniref:hypothetical protein n=1 Tax=Treponema sp. TaxID=166 RepID=UPI003EFFCFCE